MKTLTKIKAKSLQTQLSIDNTKIPYFLQIHEKHLNPQKGQRYPFKVQETEHRSSKHIEDHHQSDCSQ